MKKNKVLVLEGGLNEEHEISLKTGKEVKKSLKNLGINFKSIIVNPKTFKQEINKFDREYLCFNALHGPFGEDGSIQKILEEKNFKYTHSNAEASYNCFNKKITKEIINNTKILTPNYLTVDINNLDKKKLQNIFSSLGPFVLKPISSGSSFGIKIFRNKKDINFFLENYEEVLKIYENHNDLIAEKFISGRELTVAVIEKDYESLALEVTEILPNNDFFDYEAKYTPGFSKHILPAKIPNKVYNLCKEFAKIAHDEIKLNGVSRSDFIFDGTDLFFLEINSQPGLTSISLVPEQLNYQNISFDSLIINIINCIK